MSERYDIAAYVWPAYHDEPRWRRFMPNGEGEWQTVRQAQPKFAGHYQPRVPLWGYENEADPAVMAKKIAAAADHAVNVFIFDWYWYENQPFLEKTLNEGFLGAPNHDRLSFYLMWANHNATTLWDLEQSHEQRVIWPGSADRATFDTVAARVIERYFRQSSYYKIEGKPVFSVYEVGTLINGLGGLAETRAALDSFRARVVAAGFPGLHLQGVLWGNLPASPSGVPGDNRQSQANTVRALGFDSLTNYQWCHYVRPNGEYAAWAEKAMAQWEPWSREFPVPFFPHVSIGWDTNPRFKRPIGDVIVNSTPALFANGLRRARTFVDAHQLRPRLITVNAWNEWSESSYLEPDVQTGMGYLEAVKEVFGQ